MQPLYRHSRVHKIIKRNLLTKGAIARYHKVVKSISNQQVLKWSHKHRSKNDFHWDRQKEKRNCCPSVYTVRSADPVSKKTLQKSSIQLIDANAMFERSDNNPSTNLQENRFWKMQLKVSEKAGKEKKVGIHSRKLSKRQRAYPPDVTCCLCTGEVLSTLIILASSGLCLIFILLLAPVLVPSWIESWIQKNCFCLDFVSVQPLSRNLIGYNIKFGCDWQKGDVKSKVG